MRVYLGFFMRLCILRRHPLYPAQTKSTYISLISNLITVSFHIFRQVPTDSGYGREKKIFCRTIWGERYMIHCCRKIWTDIKTVRNTLSEVLSVGRYGQTKKNKQIVSIVPTVVRRSEDMETDGNIPGIPGIPIIYLYREEVLLIQVFNQSSRLKTL